MRVYSQKGRDQKNRETDVSSVALQNRLFFMGLASHLFPARRCRQGTG
jgi:hypothetical protein